MVPTLPAADREAPTADRVAPSLPTADKVAPALPTTDRVAAALPDRVTASLPPTSLPPPTYLTGRQAHVTTFTAAQDTHEQGSHEQPSSQQSNLQAYRSYRVALGSSNTLKETILHCDECGYPFKLQEDLNTHIKRHNDFHCNNCYKDFLNDFDLKFHIKYENNCERQWNCKDCGFQGNSQMLLKTHIEETHTPREDASYPCTMCGDVFNSKWYFKNHIRDSHSQAKEICKHFQEGRCKFEEDECWSKHQEIGTSKEKFECHTCRQVFNSKDIMMKHRKANHRTKQCNEFVKGSCKNSDEKCWFMHKNQFFYQAKVTKNPPLSQQVNL